MQHLKDFLKEKEFEIEDAAKRAAYMAMPFFNTFRPGWAATEDFHVGKLTKKYIALLDNAEDDTTHLSCGYLCAHLNYDPEWPFWTVGFGLDLSECYGDMQPVDTTNE